MSGDNSRQEFEGQQPETHHEKGSRSHASHLPGGMPQINVSALELKDRRVAEAGEKTIRAEFKEREEAPSRNPEDKKDTYHKKYGETNPNLQKMTTHEDNNSLVRRAWENIYSRLHPEVTRLRHSIPWIDELNLPRKSLEWIGMCKDLHDTYHAQNPHGEFKSAFDIIMVHLLMQRDTRLVQSGHVIDHKRNFIRNEAEKRIDKLLSFIFERVLEHDWEPECQREFNTPMSTYRKATSLEEKMQALTLTLGIWHNGGDNNLALYDPT